MKFALLSLPAASASSLPVPFIIGGTPLSRGERPFLVSIGSSWYRNIISPSGHFCGGSLISPNAVLTSALCFNHFRSGAFIEQQWVDLRRFTLSEDPADVERVPLCNNEGPAGCAPALAYAMLHPDFSPLSEGLDYDYAVIILPYSINDIEPVALNHDEDFPTTAGYDLQTMGWGWREPGSVLDEPAMSDIPQKATLDYLPNDECANFYGDQVTPRVLCAGTEGNGNCNGDAGGPIVIDTAACGPLQVGTVSYGLCAQGNTPSAHMRLSSGLRWIMDAVCEQTGDQLCGALPPTPCKPSTEPSTSTAPSDQPSDLPTYPTHAPTAAPSNKPTAAPTSEPSMSTLPSARPTPATTPRPTPRPTPTAGVPDTETEPPSASPTTAIPLTSPSASPTTASPSKPPSAGPATASPSAVLTTDRPSKPPSTSPITVSPSVSPSASPTTAVPSKSPSLSPTTARPSASPTASLTTIIPTYFPSAGPTTARPSASPSVSPTTASPSKSPSAGPTTASPSASPSASPTLSPSTQPTIPCRVNACLALDTSGSICSPDQTYDVCLDCPFTCFESNNFNRATCCARFSEMQNFALAVVDLLSEAIAAFSVVQFATNGTRMVPLSSPSSTKSALRNLTYSGGFTNHVEPISLCQDTLAESTDTDRQNVILLVTDGVPNRPNPNPSSAALSAADSAKGAGTNIHPVFIKPGDRDDVAYMENLSSDEQVIVVRSFNDLSSFEELVSQIICGRYVPTIKPSMSPSLSLYPSENPTESPSKVTSETPSLPPTLSNFTCKAGTYLYDFEAGIPDLKITGIAQNPWEYATAARCNGTQRGIRAGWFRGVDDESFLNIVAPPDAISMTYFYQHPTINRGHVFEVLVNDVTVKTYTGQQTSSCTPDSVQVSPCGSIQFKCAGRNFLDWCSLDQIQFLT